MCDNDIPNFSKNSGYCTLLSFFHSFCIVDQCILWQKAMAKVLSYFVNVITNNSKFTNSFETKIYKIQERKMSLEDRAKATGKNIEGKAQEALGNVTGDPEDKAEGKAKQAESEVRHGVEDVKDNVKKKID